MAEGNSYGNALPKSQQIINEWIETATSLGRSIPEPKGKIMFA